MDIVKYKVGQKLTHIHLNQEVTVVHSTLKPGGVNYEEAFVTVRTKQNTLIPIPVEIQDDYLTTAPPKPKWKLWPLAKQ